MNNDYISLVMLPLAAVVGVVPSFIKPAVRSSDQRDGLFLVQNDQDSHSGSANSEKPLPVALACTNAKYSERGLLIVLGNDAFGTDRSPVNLKGIGVIRILAQFLEEHTQRTVLVESFTDDSGSVSHNQELSERRADAVRSVLQEYGVARSRVSIRGYGEAHPVAPNTGAINRQRNRRIEITISHAQIKVASRGLLR